MEYHITKEDIEENSTIKTDWNIHLIKDADSFKEYRCDCHTHGLDKYGHKELQITLNFEPYFLGYLLNNLGKLIICGDKFQAGDKIFGFFEDPKVPLGFINAKDAFGEDILRVLIPDDDGKVYPDKASGIYSEQATDPYINKKHEGK
jgi:hypothetical protein